MTADTDEPTPLLIIRPPSRWSPINVRELWEFRDLLASFIKRDLKLRYRQTALGVVWVVLQPLLAAGVFSFVFGRVADLDSEGVPYFAFAFAGMLGWNAFSQVVNRMSGSLLSNSGLIAKIFFPRLILPLSTIGAVMVDFFVAMVMMTVVWVIAGAGPSWGLLTLPLWMAALLLLASGIGLLAAALMVPYRDVSYVLPVAIQTLLYASPVAYALSAVPESAQTIFQLNPLTGLLEGFRWALLDIGSVRAWPTVWLGICAVALFLLGSFNFSRMERKFADVI